MKISLVQMRDCEEHTRMIVKLFNENRVFFYNDAEITALSHSKFLQDPKRRQEFLWAITSDDKCCGMVSLYNIDRKNRRAEWGRFVVDGGFRGAGAIVEYLLLEFAFGKCALNKVYCEVLKYNRRALELHMSFGFVVEGMLRAHVFKNGIFEDVAYLGLTRGDWNAKRQVFAVVLRESIGDVEAYHE